MISIKLKKIGWNIYNINWIDINIIIKKIVIILYE